MKVHREINVHHIVPLEEVATGEGDRLEDNRLKGQEIRNVKEIEPVSAGTTTKTRILPPQELLEQEETGIYEDLILVIQQEAFSARITWEEKKGQRIEIEIYSVLTLSDLTSEVNLGGT